MRVEAATHIKQFGGLLSSDYTRGVADTTVIRTESKQDYYVFQYISVLRDLQVVHMLPPLVHLKRLLSFQSPCKAAACSKLG